MAKRRSRRGSYKYTAKRRAALKKAQAVSARKRKAAPNKRGVAATLYKPRKSKVARNVAVATVAATALTAGGIVARHKLSGSTISRELQPIVRIRRGAIKELTGTVAKGSVNVSNFGDRKEFIYTGKKQGPLGNQYKYTYTHRPISLTTVIAGRKISNPKTRGPVDHSIEGGVKYRGGKEVLPITEFIRGKPVSIISKELPTFVPERKGIFEFRSESVRGGTVEDFLRQLRKKYPKVYKA